MTDQNNIAVATQAADGRAAEFYFCPNFKQKGPRVLLLVGPAWKEAMRKHYGAPGKPFFVRPAMPHEPNTYPNGHPWGWACKPEEILLDEARWTPPQTVELMQRLLDEEIAATQQRTPS
jgi:hypothetical protein